MEMFCERLCDNQKSNQEKQKSLICDSNHNQERQTTRFRSGLTSFSFSYYNISILSIILIGLLSTPLAASQRFDIEDNDRDLITDDFVASPLSNRTNTNDNPSKTQSFDANIATPRVQQVKNDKRKHKKCPKLYRDSYCFHKGRCNWIADLNEPSCHCTKEWTGKRCQDPFIDFSSRDDDTNEEVIVIAVVVSVVVLSIIITVSCICWRRLKSDKKESVTLNDVLTVNDEEKHLASGATADTNSPVDV